MTFRKNSGTHRRPARKPGATAESRSSNRNHRASRRNRRPGPRDHRLIRWKQPLPVPTPREVPLPRRSAGTAGSAPTGSARTAVSAPTDGSTRTAGSPPSPQWAAACRNRPPCPGPPAATSRPSLIQGPGLHHRAGPRRGGGDPWPPSSSAVSPPLLIGPRRLRHRPAAARAPPRPAARAAVRFPAGRSASVSTPGKTDSAPTVVPVPRPTTLRSMRGSRRPAADWPGRAAIGAAARWGCTARPRRAIPQPAAGHHCPSGIVHVSRPGCVERRRAGGYPAESAAQRGSSTGSVARPEEVTAVQQHN